MSNVITQSPSAFRAEGHMVSGSDASGTLPISAETTRFTATGSNEMKLNMMQINQFFNGTEIAAAISASAITAQDSVTLNSPSGYLLLGNTTSGNAQIRFNKGAANNQTTTEYRVAGTAVWFVQHDSAERLNFYNSGSVVDLRIDTTSELLQSRKGFRPSISTSGAYWSAGVGHPSGVLGNANIPSGTLYTRESMTDRNQSLYLACNNVWYRCSGSWVL